MPDPATIVNANVYVPVDANEYTKVAVPFVFMVPVPMSVYVFPATE
jgi:hypothetical protein